MADPPNPGRVARERIKAAQGATRADTQGNVQTREAGITVFASSNAPTRLQDVYSRQTHKWATKYVIPTEYRLLLHLTKSAPSLAEPVRWHLQSEGHHFGPIDITDNGLGFAGRPGHSVARVPTTGPVNVTATWKGVEHKTRVDLRDFLVVSIGDSFSSGQGNPDQNGVESVGSKVVCEVPTLIKIAEVIADGIEKLADGIETGIDYAEKIPGVGDVVNASEQLTGFAADVIGEVGDLLGVGDPEDFVHMSSPPIWSEPLAWRSLRSAPSLAAQAAEIKQWSRLTTFVSVASSGATIEEGLLRPQRSYQQVGQIDEVKEMLRRPHDHRRHPAFLRPVDVLVMSIGGNDCGFSGALSDLTSEHFILGMLWRKASQKEVRASAKKALASLPAKYEKLNEAIRGTLNPKAVLVPEYPAPIFDGANKKPMAGCGIFDLTEEVSDVIQYRMGVSPSDATFIEEMGNELNAVISEAAKRHDWIVAKGVSAEFKSHGYCAPHSYWVGASQSCHQQDDLEGTAHPNAAGTKVVADLLHTELHAILNHLTTTDLSAGVRPPPHRPAA